ncbi:MotA/TolQ/ExbB proton channel family protein [Notoacmeibacter sp. MSK16QG-6]|uniref:MotA/TolQ/ExbB proton channel family protein n=1 Tax=Notoacmeibacter sp. MSK16QG-6 TaxID=2957982 RepID=UPI0020A1CCDB|nr:MotA/TolQ/ExbB proton channel family protein [Notoacmeibacter sp. MSK16QG-6]MCP1200134.1 MotA/TolQ/ExbB proton channel family protein [Notoacmeibacter sp. MSK16QG-6]
MAVTEDDLTAERPPRSYDPGRLSSPRVFLLSMVIFLILFGFLVAILSRQIISAFMTNPGLNGLILGVLIVGILLAFGQVVRLFREVGWVNSFREGLESKRDPVLLAPMRSLLMRSTATALTPAAMRSILDSIATRLDESRDVIRYLVGLLVFLGLLGTFWGLLRTIGSIGDTIQSLNPAATAGPDILDSLKTGLSEPLSGMGTAFSSSLFGLAGSLVLGFMELQAGRAQTRFYTELENWLSSVTALDSDLVPESTSSDEMRAMAESLKGLQEGGASPRMTNAMGSLAEGISGLVRNMRGEQQMLREWMNAQAQEQQKMRQTLDRLTAALEERERQDG